MKKFLFAHLALCAALLLGAASPSAVPDRLVHGGYEAPGPANRRGPIVLTEVQAEPAARADGRDVRFIELYNSNPYPQRMGGWQLSGDLAYSFPADYKMPGLSYLVLAPNPADVEAVYGITGVLQATEKGTFSYTASFALNDEIGAELFSVKLKDADPWPSGVAKTGHSLVMARPTRGQTEPAAWSRSALPGGSPGQADPARTTARNTLLVNELVAHGPHHDGYVELLNVGNGTVSLAGCRLVSKKLNASYTFPDGATLDPHALCVVDEATLGFFVSGNKDEIQLRAPQTETDAVLDAVRLPAAPFGAAYGRCPDGATTFDFLALATPGSRNAPRRAAPVVLNEIMYHPLSEEKEHEYVELYNTTETDIDLTGWVLSGDIDYECDETIPAHGYLVIANKRTAFRELYPAYDGLLGNDGYVGSLPNSSGTVRLRRPLEVWDAKTGSVATNLVLQEEVTYRDGGAWGKLADGGGSSLERVDPRADPRLAGSWQVSDETRTCGWKTIECTGPIEYGRNGNYGTPNQIEFGLQAAGECLVDTVALKSANGNNLVINPSFEDANASSWRFFGTHATTTIERDPDADLGQNVLHVRAVGRLHTGGNGIRGYLDANLPTSGTGTISLRVRWLGGSPDFLARVRGNWIETFGDITTTHAFGTPGRANSRAANAAPALVEVTHEPLLPACNAPVTVYARVADPDGLASLKLAYHRDRTTVTSRVDMVACEGGWYAATIPAGTGTSNYPLVAFRVLAADAATPAQTSVYPDLTPARECLVRYGEPTTQNTFGVYRFWITAADLAAWDARHPDSNAPVPVTFISGNDRVIYTAGIQFGGSPFHCRSFTVPIDKSRFIDYKFNFPSDDSFLDDDGLVLASDGNSGNDPTVAKEQFCYALARKLGLPNVYRRLVHFYANGELQNPRGILEDSEKPNGAMIKHWFPTKTDGRLYKVDDWFEYTPDNFDDFGYEERGATLEPFTTTDANGNPAYKLMRYRWNWLPRAAGNFEVNDYTDFFNLVGAINDTGNPRYVKNMEEVLDLDGFIGIPALQQFVGNYDAYGKERGKNAYIYDGPHGWQILGWDFDTSFGADNTRDRNMTDSVDPQSAALKLIDPSYKAMLRQYAISRRCWRKTIALIEACTTGSPELVEYRDRYNALLADGVPVTGIDGVFSNIQTRRTNVINQMNAVNATAFTLTSPTEAETNVAKLTGKAPFEIATIRCNGAELDVTWTGVTTWTAELAVTRQTMPITLEGIREDGSVAATIGATITYTGGALDDIDGQLVISGLNYNSSEPGGDYIEIYNASTTTAFDLGGLYLAGDVAYTFPAGTVVKPAHCVVVGEDRTVFASRYGAAARSLTGVYTGTLTTNGTLRLCRPARGLELSDVELDCVSWGGDGWPATAPDEVLTLLDPAADHNLPASWKTTAQDSLPPTARDLVPLGATWRYLIDAAPEGWKTASFDDSTWPEGPGPLGHDSNIGGQPVAFGTDFGNLPQRMTYYFRTTFDYQPGAQNDSLPAADYLTHRWPFNGSMEDTVTGVRATRSGSTRPGWTADRQGIKCTGGNKGVSWIDLGSNVLPNDGSPATLEIWAQQNQVRTWSRVFDFGDDTTDYVIIAWTAGTTLEADDISIRKFSGDIQRTLGGFALGQLFHISVVFNPLENGTWDVTFRKKDPTTGVTLGSLTVNSGTSGWSLKTAGQTNCWLGHSQFEDQDASATYYEVRVWNAALSDAQLTQNAQQGPDVLPTTIHGRVKGLTAQETIAGAYIVDDCAAVYLNGAEIHRSARTPEGALADTTAATTYIPQDQEGFFTEFFRIEPDQLRAGANTLAVEVHQNTPTSSDIILGLKLSATNTLMRLLPPGNYKPDDTAHLPPAEPVEPQPPVHGHDDVVLNEFMAQNTLFANPFTGAFDDWFELYNNGTNTVALDGWIVTDTLKSAAPPLPSPKASKAFVLPAGTKLAPGAALRIWTGAEGATTSPFDPANLQAPFGLGKSADAIYLFDAETNLVDSVSYSTLQAETTSLGRWPNGTGAWTTFVAPTPGQPNHPLRFHSVLLGGENAYTLRVAQPFAATPTGTETLPAETTYTLVAETGSTLPAGLAVNGTSGELSWTPTADQAPGVYFLNLCSVVAGEATDALPLAFTVLPPATSVVIAAGLSTGELTTSRRLTLNWTGRADATYAVEWCEDIAAGAWQVFPDTAELSGTSEMSVTLDLTKLGAFRPTCFFRVRETK